MKSRKEVLKGIRANVYINCAACFSEKLKGRQKVKWYGVRDGYSTCRKVQEYLEREGIADVDCKWYVTTKEVIIITLEFPYSVYS